LRFALPPKSSGQRASQRPLLHIWLLRRGQKERRDNGRSRTEAKRWPQGEGMPARISRELRCENAFWETRSCRQFCAAFFATLRRTKAAKCAVSASREAVESLGGMGELETPKISGACSGREVETLAYVHLQLGTSGGRERVISLVLISSGNEVFHGSKTAALQKRLVS